MSLTGASTVTAATVGNSGHVVIGSNATLNVTNQPGGFTDVAAHSSWEVSGNLELGGVANIAFANLTSVEGIVDLENGQKWAINPIGGTLTVGDAMMSTAYLEDGHGTTLTINGNVLNKVDGAVGADTGGKIQINGNADNFGSFYTHGGSTFNISGTLTNEASGGFVLEGPGDTVTIGNGVSNAGGIDVEGGSTLTITGGVDNSGLFVTNFNNLGGNNTITVSGMLTNEAIGTFQLLGPKDMATIGSLNNAGFVDVEGGSTLTILGDVTNTGSGANGIYTSFNSPGGGNTLNIDGNLTNSGRVGLENADTATIGKNVTNSGTFALTGGSMATIDGNLTSNTGTLDLENSRHSADQRQCRQQRLPPDQRLRWHRRQYAHHQWHADQRGERDLPAQRSRRQWRAISGSVTNAGVVRVFNGSTLTITGALANSGTC